MIAGRALSTSGFSILAMTGTTSSRGRHHVADRRPHRAAAARRTTRRGQHRSRGRWIRAETSSSLSAGALDTDTGEVETLVVGDPPSLDDLGRDITTVGG